MNNIKLFATSIMIVLLTGCTASGKKFQSFEKAEEGNNNAIVYLYRPDKFIHGSVAYHVMQIEKVIDEKSGERADTEIIKAWKLYNNSHYKAVLAPGTYPLTTNWFFDTEDFTFRANELTCLKVDITASTMLTKHPDLILVDKDTCKEEITETLLMTEEDQQRTLEIR